VRIHVALGPAEFPALDLTGQSVLVVDVLRATTTVVAAFEAGCRRVIPVADPAAARARALDIPPDERLLAGERNGDRIADFDLGNSPLEYVSERVRGRTIVLTTTNGTAAMLAAGPAARGAIGALVNIEAAVRWCLAEPRDVTVLCAGEKGQFALEDAVCAGLMVEHLLAARPDAASSDAATAAQRLGQFYGPRLDRLAAEARWARSLHAKGRAVDLAACLKLGGASLVPELAQGVIAPGAAPVTAEARPVRGSTA
jgi:2-phosphosulfolactate phosphatase